MKIHDYSSAQARNAYLARSQAAQTKDKGTVQSASRQQKPQKDEIVLSSSVAELRKYEEVAKNIPSVRSDRVNTLKTQIQAGEYNVKGTLVAESIENLLIWKG